MPKIVKQGKQYVITIPMDKMKALRWESGDLLDCNRTHSNELVLTKVQ